MEAAWKPDALGSMTIDRWSREGTHVLDPDGRIAATFRNAGEARRFVAAVNAVAGMPTETLEGFTTGVIQDPVQDLAAELTTMIEFVPFPGDRRQGERRREDRRRPATQVRLGEGE